MRSDFILLLFFLYILNTYCFDLDFINKYFYKYAEDDFESLTDEHEAGEHETDKATDKSEKKASADSRAFCDENKLMLHLAHLQVISPERILLMISSDHISEICQNVGTVIKNVEQEFKHCRELDEDNLYMLLYQGIVTLNKFVCLNDKINKKINKHHMCYKELHEEFVDCEGPPDWFEHKNETKICETYRDIINCLYVKAAQLCGIEAAHYYSCLAKSIFKQTVVATCNVPKKDPDVPDAMPYFDSYGKKIKFNKLLILGSIIASTHLFKYLYSKFYKNNVNM